MNLSSFFRALVASSLCWLVVAPSSSEAALVLRLTDGVTTFTVTDGGVGDLNGADGAITFIGGVGAFSINVSTALGDSATSYFGIHLDSVNNSTGAGTLQIAMSESGLMFGAAGPTTLSASFGGVAGGSIQGRMFVDDGDVLFAQTSSVFDSGVLGSGAFAASGSAVIGLNNPFSMTMIVDINHARGATTSFNFEGRVPEPGTLALLGIGLAGLGLARRRR